MTDDELADAFRVLFDDLHGRIDALPDGAFKYRADSLAGVAHRALERLKKHAVADGVIQPYSGGEEKPEEP